MTIPKHRPLQEKCPYCVKKGKDIVAKEIGRDVIGTDWFILLECGHTLIKPVAKESDEYDMVSSDGYRPYPFQVDGVKFIERNECSGMILDEQGLGKTIQECLLLSRNHHLFPTLIIVKSGLRAQWFSQLFRWTGKAAQVITSGREQPLFEFFDIVIVSLDTLRLIRPDCNPISEVEQERMKARGKRVPSQKPVWSDETCGRFAHICVDESHKIKNPKSSRTKAFQIIAELAGRTKPTRRVPMVMLSGTNIEKHSGEFFVTLNAIRPEMFYDQAQYHKQWCEIVDGKIGGIKNPERWKEYTSSFIIRRTRDQVMPELPKIQRNFRLVEMEGDELKAYIAVVKEFMKATEDPEVNISQGQILGYLSKMRHITGVAKVNAAVEFVEEFMLETELNRKLVIFLHHKMAGAILMQKLTELCQLGGYEPPLYLSSEVDALKGRPAMVEKFKLPQYKIMVASTLASAEGLNMQFVQDCLFMERQWNPSTEEQAESRFPRPRPEDPWPAGVKIMANYLIAAGTVDDFFTEIVEGKRRNVKQTLDGEETVWDEKNLLVQLHDTIMKKGLKRWSLS